MTADRLFSFSTYEISTIDDDRDPELSGKERKKQLEREEWQRIIDNPRRKALNTSEPSRAANMKDKDVSAEDRKSSSSSSSGSTGLDNIHLKGGNRRSSGDFEQNTESSSLENADMLNAQVKVKVTRKSSCVQKEPAILSANSFRSNLPLSLSMRSADRLRQSGTFVVSSSCNDATLGSETLQDTSTSIMTYGDEYETTFMESSV
jgi:hypothetical protein